MSNYNQLKNVSQRLLMSIILLFLPINLIACGERMPDEHRQLFTNNLSSSSLGFVESVQECNALPEVQAIGGRGNGFSAYAEIIPGTLELSSYEKWEESTFIGEVEVIQVNYSGRYNLTCQGMGGSGAQERGRVTSGEMCLTGYLSLYSPRGSQGYEPYNSEIIDRTCN